MPDPRPISEPKRPELTLTPGVEDHLSGLIERVVFHNPETGFSVIRVKVENQRDPVTLVGEGARFAPGELVRAAGAWQSNPSFGLQFRARTLEILPPSTLEGIEAYLGSGMIKGVGKAYAKKLVQRFGDQVFDVIERTPERLTEVEGLGRGLAERIAAAWEEQRAVRDIMLFLHSHGLSPLRAARIFEAYGHAAIREVTHNPYRLAQDIRGMGFQAADQLAERLGIERDAPRRLGAGLAHVLGEAQGQGHCALPRHDVVERAAELLAVPAQRIEHVLAEELERGALVEVEIAGSMCLYLPQMLEAEREVAARVGALAHAVPSWSTGKGDALIDEAEGAIGFPLGAGQKDALAMALRHRVLVITGGPGTGKTTLVKAILHALDRAGADIVLAAPTGRAARRLGESTGRDAKTLHRMLEADPGRGFRRGPDRQLECDLLVVDEVSMVDIQLMQAILLALPDEAGLFLIGDVDQLPSIGPGQVLADLIGSGVVPVARLDQIFRQAAMSRIVHNAHRINRGLLPDLDRAPGEMSDFYAIRSRTPDQGAETVRELVTRRIPEGFGVDPVQDIQVLCPINRGPLGARALNVGLQAALNPSPPASIERFGTTFAVGDKIMQIENDYEREVYNGDIGRVMAIDEAESRLDAEFDGRTHAYAFTELDRLVPAYAITVHKAQGSEYPVVVLPLLKQHGRLLRRNLIYTAVTRAKRLVVIVAGPGALELAVEGRPEPRRWSNLEAFLRGEPSRGSTPSPEPASPGTAQKRV